jgi:hypothetical protein
MADGHADAAQALVSSGEENPQPSPERIVSRRRLFVIPITLFSAAIPITLFSADFLGFSLIKGEIPVSTLPETVKPKWPAGQEEVQP